MSLISEISNVLPSVIINSGDETRPDCTMDLAKDILKSFVCKCKSKINKIRNKKYVVPFQEYIYISCLDRRIKYDIYSYTTTDEILNAITGWVNSQYNDLDFYVTHCYKPVRAGFTLKEFGIWHGTNLQVQVKLRGGCVLINNVINPYSESIIIENIVLKNKNSFELQNNTYNYKFYKQVLDFDLEAISQLLINQLDIPQLQLDKEYVIGLIEDIVFLYEDAKQYSLIKAVLRFFKYRGFKTTDCIKIILDYFTGFNLQNDEVFSDIWAFLKSDFFKKTFSLVSLVIVKDSLNKMCIELKHSSILEILMKITQSILFEENKFDPIYAIIRTIRDVFKAIKRWYDTGDINALYNEYYVDDAWFKKSSELIINSSFLSNPEEHNIDIYQFLSDLDINIEIGENNIKNFRGDTRRKLALQKTVIDLKRIRAEELTRNAAMKSRQSPFSLLVYGGSSVGKSTFVEILFGYFGNLFNLNTDPSFRYSRNGIDQYWSNFRTSHWCILFDDAAYMRPDIASNGDPSVMEIIQTINNIPFIPAQAELQDKGRTPVRCKLVLATTNSENLNAVHYFSCPLAVQRRFPYVINLEPKEEFARDDSKGMLDPQKIPPTIEGEYPDLWRIVVKKVEANFNDHNQASLEVVEAFDCIYDFLLWFGKKSKEHQETQTKISHSLDIIRNNKICDNCYMVKNRCSCIEMQNDYQSLTCERSLQYVAFILAFLSLFPKLITNYKFFKTYDWKNVLELKIREFIWWLTIERIKNSIKINYWRQSAALIAIIGTLTILIRRCRSNNFYTQGNNVSTLKENTPKFAKDEQENVWYNKTVELVPSDIPEPSRSVSDFNQFKNLVARNTALLRITNNTHKLVSDGQIFNITGNLWITNYHNVNKINYTDEIWMELIRSNSVGINNNIKCRIDPSMFKKIRNTDLVVLEVLCCPPGRDMLKFVSDKPIVGVHEGIYISRTKNGSLDFKELMNIKNHPSIKFNDCESSFGYISIPKNGDTQKGDSGSILILKTPQGPVVAGLHQAGAPKMCVSVGFQKCDFPKNQISEGTLILNTQGYEKKLGDLHPKSVPRWVETGSCNVYGTIVGFRPKPKSQVRPSYISEVATKYGYTIEAGAPVMSGWEPWHIAFKPMVNMPNNFVYHEIRACTDAFIKDVQHLKLKLGVLSDYEAINGIPGVKYIDGINRNSSMGFPWCSSKKNFLIAATKDGYPDGVTFPDEIWVRVKEIIDNYLSGKTNKPMFTAHLKDEPRSFKKIEEKKTRVFAGAPVDWSLVVRKVLLTFIKAFQENREVFEAAPGLNCQSLEWDRLYKHMTQFGTTRFVAGDYGNFDKSMFPLFIMEAFRFIEEIHRLNGCDENHIQVIRGVALDTAFNYQNFNGDIIQFFGSNPSGHPLTVVINSIVNALYMRYVFGKLNPDGFHPEKFKENVILMTYGDDNFMNVKEGCDWFNHTSIQSCLAEVGIKYTMADKEAESVPYIDIKDVSFLKRTFRFDDDMGCYLAPLEHSSINKMLTVQVKSKTISAEAQALSAIQSAVREYFFYGKEEFNNRRALLQVIISESGLDNYLIDHITDEDGNFIQINVTLPTWEELRENFFFNSKHL